MTTYTNHVYAFPKSPLCTLCCYFFFFYSMKISICLHIFIYLLRMIQLLYTTSKYIYKSRIYILVIPLKFYDSSFYSCKIWFNFVDIYKYNLMYYCNIIFDCKSIKYIYYFFFSLQMLNIFCHICRIGIQLLRSIWTNHVLPTIRLRYVILWRLVSSHRIKLFSALYDQTFQHKKCMTVQRTLCFCRASPNDMERKTIREELAVTIRLAGTLDDQTRQLDFVLSGFTCVTSTLFHQFSLSFPTWLLGNHSYFAMF